MPKLALVRHGQSQWNLENRFTGWWDADLTAKGEAEAKQAGTLLKEAGFEPKLAFSSMQTRAIRTLWIALTEMDRVWLPVEKSWRLNERHYGGLTGLDKKETAEKHGEDQVHIWRRSYDTPPPGGESLKDTAERVLPYVNAEIMPRVLKGERVLIAAHGNSLRALVMQLEGLSRDEVLALNIATGAPIVYELDDKGAILCKTMLIEREAH